MLMLKARDWKRWALAAFILALPVKALATGGQELPPTGDLPPLSLLQLDEARSQMEGRSRNQGSQYLPRLKEPWQARRYHFGLGAGRPLSIADEYNHYEVLFGSPRIHPVAWGEHYFFHVFGLDFGIRSTVAFYSASGHAATGLNESDFPLERDLTEDEIDRSQESQLVLVPMQISFAISGSPFRARWITAQAWIGHQWTYVQNTMSAKIEGATAQKPFTNTGWNEERVYGGAISFDLTWADRRAAASMKVHGISGLFLSPFIEYTTSLDSSMGKYDREVIGLMFTFETLR